MLAVGGWPNLMAEAEWAARAALRCHPNNASMLGTQALVLVRLGRFDEAEPIAEKVVQHRLKAMASAQGTALVELAANLAANRCALALLYARTGRVGAARRELAEARSLDTTCELLPELEQVLAAAPHDAVPAALVGTPTDSREAAVSIKPPLREADIAINSQVGALGARTPQSLSTTQQKGRP
jgi:tetratricopeptide (TPR) repeat protein